MTQARRAYNRKPSLRTPAERDALVVANLGLARKAAATFRASLPPIARRSYSCEDALADSYLGLLRAAELFDPARGKLSTIANWHMRQVMRRAVLRDRLVPIPCYLYGRGVVPPGVGTGSGSLLAWVAAREGSDREAAAAALHDAVARLRPPHREAVEMRLAGLTLEGSGRRLGITKEAVRQRLLRAAHDLRRMLGGASTTAS